MINKSLYYIGMDNHKKKKNSSWGIPFKSKPWVLIEAAKMAPKRNARMAEFHEKELKKGNRNRATLNLARKIVSYL